MKMIKVIGCLAAVLSMTANGQEADQDCINKMNQCIANEDKFNGMTIYHSWRCNENGELTYNQFTSSQCKLSMQSRNPLETSSIMNANGQPSCCEQGSGTVKLEPNGDLAEGAIIKCKRSEEQIKIIKAILSANCLNTEYQDLLSDESFVGACNGKNSCDLQNANIDPHMNVCAEAELKLEFAYLCYYDPGMIGVGEGATPEPLALNSRLLLNTDTTNTNDNVAVSNEVISGSSNSEYIY